MPFGLYFHIPYCFSRCRYCDFYAAGASRAVPDAYVDALLQALAGFSAALPGPPDTVYFGGGTPSLLTPAQVERLLAAAAPRSGAEVTLEANPETVTPEQLEKLASDLAAGYQAYAAAHGQPDPSKMGEYFADYMSTERAQKVLSEGVAAMVDTSGLQEQLAGVMKDYMTKLMGSFGESMGDALKDGLAAVMEQVMEQIAAYGEETRGTFAHSLAEGIWLYVQRLKNNRSIVPDDQLPWLALEGGLAALLLAAAFVRWRAARKEKKTFPKGQGILWKLLLLGAVRSSLWMYLILRERVPERISHPLYFCELVMLAWLFLDTVCGMRQISGQQSSGWQTSGPEGLPVRVIRIAALVLSLAAVVIWLPQEAERTDAEYARREQGNAVNLAALSRYRQENLYLADVMSTVDFSEKLFTEKIRPGNYDLLGGWMCKSPHSEKKLAAFGYESMGQAVLSGENVRFVGEADTDWSWLTELLAEHGGNGELVLEEEITAEGRSLYIWRLERN